MRYDSLGGVLTQQRPERIHRFYTKVHVFFSASTVDEITFSYAFKWNQYKRYFYVHIYFISDKYTGY